MTRLSTISSRAAIIAALLLLVIGGLLATEAVAHQKTYDSVTDSEYLVWDSTSRYAGDVTHAAAAWDKYNCWWSSTCNGVDVDHDDQTTSPVNIMVSDMNLCSVGWTGAYRSANNPDDIYMNHCFQKNFPDYKQKSTLVHEFGHALGFDHPPSRESWGRIAIMHPCSYCWNTSTVPLSHDRADYYDRWIE